MPSVPSWVINLGFHVEDWESQPGKLNVLDHAQATGVIGARVPFFAENFYGGWAPIYDEFTVACTARGIHILPLLLGVYGPITDMNYWNQFLRDFVARYGFGGSIITDPAYQMVAFEIWNEPNVAWQGSGTGTGGWTGATGIQNYAALTKNSYATLNSLNSDYRIICGGLAEQGPDGSAATWLGQVLGSSPAFQHCAVHPYYGSGLTDSTPAKNIMTQCRAALDSHNLSNAQLWPNEFAWHGSNESSQDTFLREWKSWLDSHAFPVGVTAYFPYYDGGVWADWGLVHSNPPDFTTFHDRPAASTWRSYTDNNWVSI